MDMTRETIDNMLAAVAEKNGTTHEEVYQEIQKAIDQGFNNLDPKIQAAWNKIPHDGNQPPMVEDLIYYLTQKVKGNNKAETV